MTRGVRRRPALSGKNRPTCAVGTNVFSGPRERSGRESHHRRRATSARSRRQAPSSTPRRTPRTRRRRSPARSPPGHPIARIVPVTVPPGAAGHAGPAKPTGPRFVVVLHSHTMTPPFTFGWAMWMWDWVTTPCNPSNESSSSTESSLISASNLPSASDEMLGTSFSDCRFAEIRSPPRLCPFRNKKSWLAPIAAGPPAARTGHRP